MNVIARAYQLARSGEFSKVEHIERKLTREGYTAVADHLSGKLVRRELNEMMRAARAEPARSAGGLTHAPAE